MSKLNELKREQVDCEWCPNTDCAGYQFECNLGCLHYACNSCFKKKVKKITEDKTK